jgi:hypothetical protein
MEGIRLDLPQQWACHGLSYNNYGHVRSSGVACSPGWRAVRSSQGMLPILRSFARSWLGLPFKIWQNFRFRPAIARLQLTSTAVRFSRQRLVWKWSRVEVEGQLGLEVGLTWPKRMNLGTLSRLAGYIKDYNWRGRQLLVLQLDTVGQQTQKAGAESEPPIRTLREIQERDWDLREGDQVDFLTGELPMN